MEGAGGDSPLTRGSPAGSLSRKHFVCSTAGGGGGGGSLGTAGRGDSKADLLSSTPFAKQDCTGMNGTGGAGHPDRKVSKIQSGEKKKMVNKNKQCITRSDLRIGKITI